MFEFLMRQFSIIVCDTFTYYILLKSRRVPAYASFFFIFSLNFHAGEIRNVKMLTGSTPDIAMAKSSFTTRR